MIPVHGDVHTQLHPSLSLNNILCTPKLMKNLIYIRKFTTYNNVSTEFDPLDFSIKALGTGKQILRFNSWVISILLP